MFWLVQLLNCYKLQHYVALLHSIYSLHLTSIISWIDKMNTQVLFRLENLGFLEIVLTWGPMSHYPLILWYIWVTSKFILCIHRVRGNKLSKILSLPKRAWSEYISNPLFLPNNFKKLNINKMINKLNLYIGYTTFIT